MTAGGESSHPWTELLRRQNAAGRMLARGLAELLAHIELLRQNLAAVAPVIAEVEHELEHLARLQAAPTFAVA
jgi:hypothetical protein